MKYAPIRQLNFMPSFTEYVFEGSKQQTIRNRRKNEIHPGDTLYLFSGARTIYSQLLRKETCADTGSVALDEDLVVLYDYLPENLLKLAQENPLHNELEPFTHSRIESLQERNLFAWLDGFRSVDDAVSDTTSFEIMRRWWCITHQLRKFKYAGDIFKWEATPAGKAFAYDYNQFKRLKPKPYRT